MVNITQDLREMSTKLLDELSTVDKEIEHISQWRLACERQRGKPQLIKEQYRNEQRIRKNLSLHDPEVAVLIRQQLLVSMQKCLKRNYAHIEKAIKNVKDFDMTSEVYELRKRLPVLSEDMITDALSSKPDSDWAAASYERYQYQGDNTRWQMSTFGMRFRSKSELLIAEMLHKYGVQFRYEQVLHFGESMLVPDFTIKREDEKLIYWEHEGLTNSREYLARQMKKHQIYAMNNIVPWDNFIVTYDSSDGMIDLRIVEAEIKNKLL